jgi:hypothetical protein
MKRTVTGLFLSILAIVCAWAQGGQDSDAPPAAVAHPREALTADFIDLKFSEMFSLPVGPLGLEPSAKLLSLDGKPVRITGYMVSTESPVPGRLILSPLPVMQGDEDERLADDLPLSVVFVHLSGNAATQAVPGIRGLVRLAGILQVGSHDEPDGHVSSVRLLIDEASSQALTRLGEQPQTMLPQRER